MSVSAIIFYVISACILGAGILAVTSARIFRSAIWLLFSLVSIAALYFWMKVEFVAAVQIIVYVGGIVVLIIFSIFLTQESGKKMPKPGLQKIIFSVLAALFGFALSYRLISQYPFPIAGPEPFHVSVSEMGTEMLSTSEHGYILPFEVVSILLLAAMIGCIVIAMKAPQPKDEGPRQTMAGAHPHLPVLSELIHPEVPEPLTAEELPYE
jgi:NADH-quinone oxidoreductase subunit J